ncbi:hypothetical protein BgiBS90_026312, partial [Biomphalaria glabrata]
SNGITHSSHSSAAPIHRTFGVTKENSIIQTALEVKTKEGTPEYPRFSPWPESDRRADVDPNLFKLLMGQVTSQYRQSFAVTRERRVMVAGSKFTYSNLGLLWW